MTAVLAAVPCSGYKLSVFQFRTFSPKRKFSALCTGKTVFLCIIGHVFNPANLFLEAPCFLRFIIGRFYEAELAVRFQI